MRRLGRFELALTLTDEYAALNAVAVVRLAGGPASAVLRQALDEVQARHPLLGVHLTKDRRGHAFAKGAPEIPLAERERAGDDGWQSVAEDELDTPVDAARGPLLRAIHLAGGTRSELVLTFHHAVMDATSATALVDEILRRAERVVRGEAAETAAPRAPLPPVETRFPVRFQGLGRVLRGAVFVARQTAGELAYRWRRRGTRRPAVPRGAKNRILCMELDRDATRGLIRGARRHRVSLMSAAGAAVLLAVAKHLYDNRSLALRSIFFADLRPYVRPRPDAEELGAYLSMLRLTTTVEPPRGFWHLAERLNRQSYSALKRGDKFLAALLAPWLIRTLLASGKDRMGATAVSYTGPLKLQPSYGAARLVGFHSFVSDIDLGPEYAAQVRLFDGRFGWDVNYLDRDLDRDAAREIAGEVKTLLEAAGRPQSREGA